MFITEWIVTMVGEFSFILLVNTIALTLYGFMFNLFCVTNCQSKLVFTFLPFFFAFFFIFPSLVFFHIDLA